MQIFLECLGLSFRLGREGAREKREGGQILGTLLYSQDGGLRFETVDEGSEDGKGKKSEKGEKGFGRLSKSGGDVVERKAGQNAKKPKGRRK